MLQSDIISTFQSVTDYVQRQQLCITHAMRNSFLAAVQTTTASLRLS